MTSQNYNKFLGVKMMVTHTKQHQKKKSVTGRSYPFRNLRTLNYPQPFDPPKNKTTVSVRTAIPVTEGQGRSPDTNLLPTEKKPLPRTLRTQRKTQSVPRC